MDRRSSVHIVLQRYQTDRQHGMKFAIFLQTAKSERVYGRQLPYTVVDQSMGPYILSDHVEGCFCADVLVVMSQTCVEN